MPGQGNSDCPYTPTAWIDQAGESTSPEANCVEVDGVDAEWLNGQLEVGCAKGPWVPGVNDCQVTVRNLLRDARLKRALKSLGR